MLLESLHEVKHLFRSSLKCLDLPVLFINLLICDCTHKTIIFLYPMKLILRRDLRHQAQLSLQVRMQGWLHKDRKLLRVNQVGTPTQLLDKHVEQKAPFFDEGLLLVIHYFLSRNGRNVKARESFNESLSQGAEVRISSLNLKLFLP